MTYPDNFEQKIGFDKVRQLVGKECISPLGEDLVEQMSFSHDYEDVMTLLHQTEEMLKLLSDKDNDFSIGNIYDIREGLKRIKVTGLFLDEDELFALHRSLGTVNDVVSFLQGCSPELYPNLVKLSKDVLSFPMILRRIDEILDKFGKVKDNASNELMRIRRESLKVQGNVSRSLISILHQAQSDGYVEKDAQATLREGRLVIPVSPAFKRKMQGIVHDESATGKTVYIEPQEVVESNNRLRELQNEEKREITRILKDFTEFLRPILPDVLLSFEFLGIIDFLQAKAKFAINVEGVLPQVKDLRLVDWKTAKHPLLLLSLKRQNKDLVPLDIHLDGQNRILLISGPNAGGKSVCLKTIGLLQYMMQCGLLPSVSAESTMGMFGTIFIDIGDEQSIENDLSTYSSHLTNMKYFVRNADNGTLLLIDEFGGGTEPQIGGAIAEALLEKYNEQGAFGVITTHYSNLKHYAEEADGVINGAMLYDRHQMQPLFKLSIGNPGSSFAVEIARKIGLPEDVIKRASDKVGEDYINFDKHLQDVARDKRYWENKRQQIRLREKHIAELEEKYKEELERIGEKRKEVMRKAKTEAQELLKESNRKIEGAIRAIKEAKAEKDKTREVRSDIEKFKNDVRNAQEHDAAIAERVNKINQRADQKKQQLHPIDNHPIEVGDRVHLKGQTAIGEVMEIKGKNVMIGFGSIKSNVKIDRLERVSRAEARKQQRENTVSIKESETLRQRRLQFNTEIDIRGMRAEEALQAVSYFIDGALMAGVGSVRILHGTGTGALRQVVRQYLSTIGGVANYHDEHVQLGGAGITVVEM